MEKLYLIIHTYKNTAPAVYIFEKESIIPSFLKNDGSRTAKIFEFDAKKIEEVLTEVEFNLTPKK